MNNITDFYLITFHKYNDCYSEILDGGTTPMDSTDKSLNTLVRFVSKI
jgi:hypothetical protein